MAVSSSLGPSDLGGLGDAPAGNHPEGPQPSHGRRRQAAGGRDSERGYSMPSVPRHVDMMTMASTVFATLSPPHLLFLPDYGHDETRHGPKSMVA